MVSRRCTVMNGVRAFWQRRRLRIAAFVLIALGLVALGLVVRESYPDISHLTDSITVTVKSWHPTLDSSELPQQVYTSVIQSSATARRVREIMDAARPLSGPYLGSCAAISMTVNYDYDFVFTWRGTPTEEIRWDYALCADFDIIQGGRETAAYNADLSRSQFDEIVLLTGIPVSPAAY
jgi:hypothetical protein